VIFKPILVAATKQYFKTILFKQYFYNSIGCITHAHMLHVKRKITQLYTMNIWNKFDRKHSLFPLNRSLVFLAVSCLCSASVSCSTSNEWLIAEHLGSSDIYCHVLKGNQLDQLKGCLWNFLRQTLRIDLNMLIWEFKWLLQQSTHVLSNFRSCQSLIQIHV
jgi:hypothetical protein